MERLAQYSLGMAMVVAACVGCATSSHKLVSGTEAFSPAGEATERQLSLARLSERHGQPERAEQIYRALLDQDAKNRVACHRLAVLEARGGKYAESNARFEQALQMGPSDPNILADWGYCLYLQDQLEDAEAKLREALKQSPRLERARNNLAVVLGEQGRLDESLAEFRQVVGDAKAHSNLGIVCARTGRSAESEQNLHRALARDNNLRSTADALCQLKERQGQLRPVAVTVDVNSSPSSTTKTNPPTAVVLRPAETTGAPSSPGPSRSALNNANRIQQVAAEVDSSRMNGADVVAAAWREETPGSQPQPHPAATATRGSVEPVPPPLMAQPASLPPSSALPPRTIPPINVPVVASPPISPATAPLTPAAAPLVAGTPAKSTSPPGGAAATAPKIEITPLPSAVPSQPNWLFGPAMPLSK